ncbi:hypothetical protein D3C87_2008210 [compost metagenome]
MVPAVNLNHPHRRFTDLEIDHKITDGSILHEFAFAGRQRFVGPRGQLDQSHLRMERHAPATFLSQRIVQELRHDLL